MDEKTFQVRGAVTKVDDSLGLVFGWGIISTEGGEPYIDLQDDHIPPSAMLKASMDFAKNSRAAKEMHDGPDDRGVYVFLWPMTHDIAKAMGITTDREGLMVGLHPDDAMLAKFKSGELRGFSIGGVRITDVPSELEVR